MPVPSLLLVHSFRATKCLHNPYISGRRTAVTVLCIYLFSFFLVLPNSYHSKVTDKECWSKWPNPRAEFTFYVVFAVLAIITPIIIAASNYYQIAILVASTSEEHTHSFSRQRQQENALLYKTMLCTITVFAILTVPYACFLVVYMALVAFSETYFIEHQNMLTSLNYVVFTTSAFNSCVNPFIYARYDMRILGCFEKPTNQSMPDQRAEAKSFIISTA